MIILGPVAIAENWVIGGDNDLPWHLPEDLKHFKKITLGKTVLMGRKTYDSIFKRLGKPLPGRINVVITRQRDYTVPEGVLVFHSVEEALNALGNSPSHPPLNLRGGEQNITVPPLKLRGGEEGELSNQDIYIIGGAEIFKLGLPLAEKMYITHVKGNYEGDAYFPKIDFTKWQKIADEPHEGYTFAVYKKAE